MSSLTPGRNQLLLMLGIMLVTLAGSYLLFKLAQSSGVWGTVNKGEFVTPTQSVADFEWQTIESAPFSREFPAAFAPTDVPTATGDQANAPRESVNRTWWLLTVANSGCARDCVEALQHMRSLQVLLTKDATRVRRALLLPGASNESLQEQYPRLIQLSRGRSPEITDGIYILDPTGVLVLRYPLAGSAADVQKDLKRLLKYSQLG